jgi:hypothetical protein
MGFQSRKNPNQRQNDIWLQALCPSTMNTIRRKVVASPKSKPWWILWVRVCAWFVFVHQECYNYTLTNLVFGLCKLVWIVDLLVIIYSFYPITPTHPSYPKMLQVGEHIPTFFFFHCFHLRIHIWVLRGVWGCVTWYLSVEFKRTTNGLLFHQTSYAWHFLNEFHMADSTLARVPIHESTCIQHDIGIELINVSFY